MYCYGRRTKAACCGFRKASGETSVLSITLNPARNVRKSCCHRLCGHVAIKMPALLLQHYRWHFQYVKHQLNQEDRIDRTHCVVHSPCAYTAISVEELESKHKANGMHWLFQISCPKTTSFSRYEPCPYILLDQIILNHAQISIVYGRTRPGVHR